MPTVEEILRKTFEHLEEMLDEDNRERAGADGGVIDGGHADCREKTRESPVQGRQRDED